MTTRKSSRDERRITRRRQYFDDRLADAVNARQRLAVAVEYLQAVLAAADSDTAAVVASTAVEYLRRTAEATQMKELK